LACSITTRLVKAADSCSFRRWAPALDSKRQQIHVTY
jgi:hypothetical protein